MVIKLHIFKHIKPAKLLITVNNRSNRSQITITLAIFSMHPQQPRCIKLLWPVSFMLHNFLPDLALTQLI